MAFTSRLFSTCPRVSKIGDRLVASTAWRMRIFTLGLLFRQVAVDPKAKELTLYGRYLWVFTSSRRVLFKEIEAVTYGYRGSGSGGDSGFFGIGGAHDTHDRYSVGLRLRGYDELHIFYFSGEGSFVNKGPWPDWTYWSDYTFDTVGTQDSESRVFVELLSKMIGVTVVPPSY